MAKLSVVIPARNEPFLRPTVVDLLAKAKGDTEVIAVLDGYWPDPPLPDDPRLIVIHNTEPIGMRPCINAGMRIAKGEFLMKLDAHCLVGEGFDEILKADCEEDWIVVPRRGSLDAEHWCREENGKAWVDAHYLSYPYDPNPSRQGDGLQGVVWSQRSRARLDVPVDLEMQSQGSCWFTTRKHWDRLGEMEVTKYGDFVREFQELGLKTFLGGGRCMVNKNTFYLHLHKGKRYGRGYHLDPSEIDAGSKFCVRYWMLDEWKERAHDLRWLIEKFSPVPGWPVDLDEAFARARTEYGVA
jgi:hypothetical protein